MTVLTPTLYLFLRSLAFREQIIDRQAHQPYSDDTVVTDEVELIVTVEEKAKLDGTWNSKDFPSKKEGKNKPETERLIDQTVSQTQLLMNSCESQKSILPDIN